jgi:hypothetical protein
VSASPEHSYVADAIATYWSAGRRSERRAGDPMAVRRLARGKPTAAGCVNKFTHTIAFLEPMSYLAISTRSTFMATTYSHFTDSRAPRMRDALACSSGVNGNAFAGAIYALARGCMR